MSLKSIYQPIKDGLKGVEGEFGLLADSKKDQFPELHEMLKHILAGGKAVRPALVLLAGKCFDYNLEKLTPMATATELLHIATLVHDDAIDKAATRRGRATVNSKWGLEKAVLLGDFLFARAGEYAAEPGNLKVIRLFSHTLRIISNGELKQSFSSFSPEQSYEDYIERIYGKTASLIIMSIRSGAILAGASEENEKALYNYGYNIGLAFQIVDDILDFTGDEKELGKPIGSDLSQGTITLPSLMLLNQRPKDNPIQKIFEDEDREKNIALAVDMILNSDIIEKCYSQAEEYVEKACKELETLPPSEGRECLHKLAHFIVKRKK